MQLVHRVTTKVSTPKWRLWVLCCIDKNRIVSKSGHRIQGEGKADVKREAAVGKREVNRTEHVRLCEAPIDATFYKKYKLIIEFLCTWLHISAWATSETIKIN